MSGEAKPGLLLVIGIGCLAGAAALAWFSSVQTLQLTRTDGRVAVSLQARLFALWPVSDTRLEDVRSARTLTTIPAVSRPRPFTQLLFDTPSGAVDLWSTQSPFLRQADEIKGFFDDAGRHEATISSIEGFRETARFVAAQAATLFLALCGIGCFYLAVRALLGTDADIGPRAGSI